MEDVIVRLVELDPRIKGFIRPDSNGDYNIYINACLCPEARQTALEHELEHIQLRHVYSERPVKELEDEVK